MAWIESHEDIATHPKTFELMSILDIELPAAVGILHLLWHFTMKFAWQDGDLSRYSNAAIARFLGTSIAPDTLISALEKSGWLDEKKIHNWLKYAGKIVKDRLYNLDRKQSYAVKRRKTSLNGVKRRKTAYAPVKSPLPNLTVPNHTIPNITEPKEETTTASAPKQLAHAEKEMTPEKVNARPLAPHQIFVEQFKNHYEGETGDKFNAGVQTYTIAANLLKKHGLQALQRKAAILARLCKSRSTWFTKNGYADFTIEKLSSRWNEILPTSVGETEQEKWERLIREKEAQDREAEIRDCSNAG